MGQRGLQLHGRALTDEGTPIYGNSRVVGFHTRRAGELLRYVQLGSLSLLGEA